MCHFDRFYLHQSNRKECGDGVILDYFFKTIGEKKGFDSAEPSYRKD